LITISSHRRRRGPGIGAIFERVTRSRPSTLERSRRCDGHQYGGTQPKYGGTQPTDISMIDRREYRLRLSGGSSPHHEVRVLWSRWHEGVSTPPDETAGCRGLRIDDRPGGRYLGIPRQSPIAFLTITPAPTKSGTRPDDATARPISASP